MKKYSVLVVDDSPLMRKLISTILEESNDFFVIGKARNGIDALEKVERIKPDLVIMDIEMPEMNGLVATQKIMSVNPLPIVVLSNDTTQIIKSFDAGAVDFILKDQLIHLEHKDIIIHFYERLLTAVKNTIIKIVETDKPLKEERKVIKRKKTANKLLVIGSSTGGPAALKAILPKCPTDFSLPILVIQHMPPGFTKSLAERFNNMCELHVKEVEDGEILDAGTIYIAPAGVQTLLSKHNNQFVANLKVDLLKDNLYKPSIDVTLLSIEDNTKEEVITVILTGMGNDGLKGCAAMKEKGAKIIAESKESCVVYGMPKVVIEAGLADIEKPLPNIFDAIMSLTYKNK